MYCWSCGAKNADTCAHCTACGKPLRPGGDIARRNAADGRDDAEPFIDLTEGFDQSGTRVFEQTTHFSESKSLDDLEPAMREKLIRMLRDGGGGKAEQWSKTVIRVRDADGKEHTYNSIDELPPEHAALREQLLRQAGRSFGSHDENVAGSRRKLRKKARVRSIRSTSGADFDNDNAGAGDSVITRDTSDGGGLGRFMMWGFGVAAPMACIVWGVFTLRGTRMFGYFELLETPAEQVRERFGTMASGVLILAAGALAHLQFVWGRFPVLARLRWRFMLPLFAVSAACIIAILKTAN